MTSTAPSSTAFLYVEADVPAGQTLVEWRRERHLARQAARARRSFRLPFPRRLRWAT
ncbi:MAG TPA: hypothetical protein VGV67_08975 [Solirubrobacteraceae bacterium]|nr:hypothetical protein [Solirubrobacteraceae bacterium]